MTNSQLVDQLIRESRANPCSNNTAELRMDILKRMAEPPCEHEWYEVPFTDSEKCRKCGEPKHG